MELNVPVMGPLWHYQSGRAKTDASDQRSIVAARCEEDDDDEEEEEEGSALPVCARVCETQREAEEEVKEKR